MQETKQILAHAREASSDWTVQPLPLASASLPSRQQVAAQQQPEPTVLEGS